MSQLKRYNGSSWENVGGAATTGTDLYEDISANISIHSPSDLVVQDAQFKNSCGNKTLNLILVSSTGFPTGGAATYVCTLPDKAKPTTLVVSTCGMKASSDYATWDGVNDGRAVAYLRIESNGNIYIRYTGTTMKTAQIHITY